MKELSLKCLLEEEKEVFYEGYYKLKKIKFLVNNYDGNHYSLLIGDLTKDEWEIVVGLHYNDDYEEIN